MPYHHRTPSLVVILGAGPYGLSLAAHLRAKGVPFRIFGRPMQTWATQMPAGMHLKSDGFASNLSTGATPYTLAQFCAEIGRPYHDTLLPIPVEIFTAYGEEFARRFVPNLEPENISSLQSVDGHYRIRTESGEEFLAHRVVVATGLSVFQHIPQQFRHLPASHVTHPAQHTSFEEFAGREVTVLGRGASSLNAAALLHEAGARVTLISRSRKIHVHELADPTARPLHEKALHPSSPLGTSMRSWLACKAPDLFHFLPSALRRVLTHKHLGPAGGASLKDRLHGFTTLLGAQVHAAESVDGSGGRLRLTLTDANSKVRQHVTSHLIAGTGYRTDLKRLTFLSPSMQEQICTTKRGTPRLSRNFESSVKGLHFIGPVAAPEFGPLVRFVAGAQFAAERVSLHLQRAWLRDRRAAESELPLGSAARQEQIF